jgi:hypothetical protein
VAVIEDLSAAIKGETKTNFNTHAAMDTIPLRPTSIESTHSWRQLGALESHNIVAAGLRIVLALKATSWKVI